VAHSLSAQKRVRQNEKHRLANRADKSALKTEIRKLQDLIRDRNVAGAKGQLVKVYKKLDQVAAKGVIHKNMASRQKSRLSVRVTALEKPGTAAVATA
jgi:small subunit ribosomal protein S20